MHTISRTLRPRLVLFAATSGFAEWRPERGAATRAGFAPTYP